MHTTAFLRGQPQKIKSFANDYANSTGLNWPQLVVVCNIFQIHCRPVTVCVRLFDKKINLALFELVNLILERVVSGERQPVKFVEILIPLHVREA
jgi:hypothetical protein